MLILASNSASRAHLLKEAKLDFQQITCNYNENLSKNLIPQIYVQKIVLQKEKQFLEIFKNKFENENLLFADSIVCAKNQILTKAKTKDEARKMLALQSGKQVEILSCFLLSAKDKRIFSLSKTTLYFAEFKKDELENYIQNEGFKNKAGAIMCEGFHKNYIIKRIGELSTALGLNMQNLKAYL